jgi:hypothetical protein
MASEPPRHPLADIDPDKCYEWMLSQCAAAESQRQAREDGLVGTVIQISSAALLAVPGVIFAASAQLPQFHRDPLLYLGLIAFGFSLVAAMVEQYLSGLAYAKHVEIVQAYYLQESDTTEDKLSRRRARSARHTCYACFGVALIFTALGLLNLRA